MKRLKGYGYAWSLLTSSEKIITENCMGGTSMQIKELFASSLSSQYQSLGFEELSKLN